MKKSLLILSVMMVSTMSFAQTQITNNSAGLKLTSLTLGDQKVIDLLSNLGSGRRLQGVGVSITSSFNESDTGYDRMLGNISVKYSDSLSGQAACSVNFVGHTLPQKNILKVELTDTDCSTEKIEFISSISQK